ncbi:MAG: hypothetical protein A4E66_00382 [Syntrophus sp. PtaB.Bin001]|jgi:hypothetical protein|nr:MAG: hypothetical protein A4E66_00382 [Syntrophus sp. PtaB.Bin001]
MSQKSNIAYHGSGADYDTLKNSGGILPRVMWKSAPDVVAYTSKLPPLIQYKICKFIGPKLRGKPGEKGGVGDADPNLSVSLSWNPKVCCFFPPAKKIKKSTVEVVENETIYLYAIDMSIKVDVNSNTILKFEDVDAFAKKCGVYRGYMEEIAVSYVPIANILGYCTVTRTPPPPSIESIVTHKMKVKLGEYVPKIMLQIDKVKDEIKMNTFGELRLSKSIAGTFHTTDSMPSKTKNSLFTQPKTKPKIFKEF